MNKSTAWLVAVFILVLGAGPVFGQSEEAKRHFDSGVAALQTKDYEAAIKELEQAARLAPNWPEAFYNLGLAWEGAKKYGDAVKSYREYLRLAPNASDAEEVKSLIARMESRAEQGEGIDKVYKMMMSDQFERKQISQKELSGQAELALGFGYPDGGPLFRRFRMESGQMQASNDWFTNQYADAVRYSGNPLPRPRDWEPVEVSDRFYEYTFSDYMARNNGYVLRGDYGVKGEIISIDPPRVKEIQTCSISWGVPFTEKAPPWKSSWIFNGAMEFIWEYVAKSAGARDPALDSSLLNAALNNKLEEAGQLIARGANVEAMDTTGQTPLHYAAFRGNKAVAELLIARGAKINAKDGTGSTPLHNAVLSSGNVEVIDLLIAKGADIYAKNSGGTTPLHFAAKISNKEQAELLIAKGAEVNAKDITGATPLHDAAWSGITITAELLIAKGADINAQANNGRTPLSYAVYGNRGAVVELLIAKGADINAKDNEKKTPLMIAISQNRKEMADLLEKHGAK